MKQFLRRYWVLPMLCIVAVLSLCAAETSSSAIVATVDGEAVTLGDVMRETNMSEAVAARAFSEDERNEEIEKIRRDAVDRIIDRKLFVREFEKLNTDVPLEYVERLLDEVALSFGCKSRTELTRKAREAGTSIEILRQKAIDRIKADMVIGREMYTSGEPTPREVYEYFEAHRNEFTKPERINPALLLLAPDTPPERVQEVQNKLTQSPESFGDMVRTFSVGPNREQGGVIGYLTRGVLRGEFQAALPKTGLKAGMVLGPVTTPEGIYFVQIHELDAGTAGDFGAIKEVIEKKLAQERENAAMKRLSERLRKEAVICYYFGKDAQKSAPPTVTVSAPETETKVEVQSTPADPKSVPAEAKSTAAKEKSVQTADPKEVKTAEPVVEPAAKPIAKPMEKKTMVTLKTNFGDIKLELYPQYAPKTVANFLEYVKSGFYNGTLFHRVIDGFMIQGGGFDQKFHQKETREPIENEADNRLSNEIGTIAMARTMEPHSATAQFFINVANNDFLDFRSPSPQYYGYCVFGKVVEGMDVVNKIKGVKTGGRGGHQDVPKEDVVILEAVAEE